MEKQAKLTPSILKKNGFKPIGEGDNEVFLLKEIQRKVIIGISFDEGDTCVFLLDNDCGEWPGYQSYDLFNIKSVNNFQNLLKLLGIEKDIKL